MTLEPAITEFLEHCQADKDLSPDTVRAYRSDLGDLLSFVPGYTPVTDIGPETVRAFLANLADPAEQRALHFRDELVALREAGE